MFVPEPGSIVAGKYCLDRVIGKGGTGTVWRATQVGLDRPVAVKLMHPDIAASEEAHARFAREARVAASLDHPATVAVVDVGDQDGALYLVMEYLDGESLRARLDRGRLALDDALPIVREVAAALAAAHRIRLVHRDIKPENVILGTAATGPWVKVVDFGLAFIADPEPGSTRAMGRVTAEGMVFGTPAYMSPEQVRGTGIGPAADVYSLGCVLYELIAERPPFVGSVADILTRHVYAPAIPLRQLELSQPPPQVLDDLVLSMLAKSPAIRPTAHRVAAQLAELDRAANPGRPGRTPVVAGDRSARFERTFADVASSPSALAGEHALAIGVIGALEPDLALGLAASGIEARPWTAEAPGPERLVWAPGLDDAQLRALAGAGKLVVAGIAPGEITRLPRLVRAGVADAVTTPVELASLVVRLRRLARADGAPR